MTGNPKEKKFLFDTHNFDVPDVPEPDPDAPPPPPVFSLEEIGMARDEGFRQGHLAGLEEAAASRAQYIATQMEKLSHELKGVLLAEQRREKTYENEVTGLCEAIFARVFPALNQVYGLTEVTSVIRRVFASQTETSELVVEVPVGESEEIRQHLETDPEIDFTRLLLRENATLERGSCRISWQNGGALRDHQALAEQILLELQQTLAPAPQNPHNDSSNGE